MKRVVVLFLISILFLSGCSIKKTEELTNSEKFANEYQVEDNNPFEYITLDDLKDLFDNGTGLLFFGNSDCEWCIKSAVILNELLKDEGIDAINYFNPVKDNDLVLYMINEEIENIEIENVWLPSLYVIVDGEIISYSNDSLENYINDENDFDSEKKLKKDYLKLIELYKEHI